MNTRALKLLSAAAAILAAFVVGSTAFAQAAVTPRRDRGPQGPQVVSPEVATDRHVTFRIHAPQAQAVRLSGGDIPGNNEGATMAKETNGVWEVTLGPLEPGAYRHHRTRHGRIVRPGLDRQGYARAEQPQPHGGGAVSGDADLLVHL